MRNVEKIFTEYIQRLMGTSCWGISIFPNFFAISSELSALTRERGADQVSQGWMLRMRRNSHNNRCSVTNNRKLLICCPAVNVIHTICLCTRVCPELLPGRLPSRKMAHDPLEALRVGVLPLVFKAPRGDQQ